MKRYLYVLLLIMSALIVDVCAQTSPTYDDKTPPAFEWGNGKMNAQKQGTPTTGDREIIANINVTVDNVAERLISKTTDKSITDVAEDILEAVNSNNTDLAELAVLLKDASGTTSIFDKVNNIDGRLIYTPEGATESVDITELVAKLDVTLNTVATQIIASMPSMSTVDAQINYLASEAEKLQVATLTSIIGNINSNIEGLRWTEFRHANSVKAEDDVSTDTVVSLLREIKNKEAGGDVELSDTNNLISSNTEKLVTNVNGSDKSVAELVADVEDAVRHIQLATITTDIESIETVLENNLYDSRYGNRPLYMQLSFNSANEVNAVNSFSEKVKALADTNNDTVMEHLRSVDAKLTYTSDGNSKNVAELVADVEDAVRHIQSGSMSVDLTDTNNLISNNTEKLVANVTSVADSLVTTVTQSYDNGDDSMTTSSQKTIAEILGEQFGNLRDMSSVDSETNESEHNAPNCCKFTWDFFGMFTDWLYGDYMDGTLSLIFRHTDITNTLVDSDFHKRVVSDVTRNGVTNSIEYDLGVADSLISQGEIPLGDQSSDNYLNVCMTVADALTMDNDGNPTHVLGRILQAVENGGSGSSGSSGSVDLQKIERGVGVVLNEGSEGGKGEPPEMEINLVDMFYDKGTGIGGFDFRGDDSAYLDEGISMYDMTKAGLFGLDEYSNVKPLLKDMLQVSFSADSSMPKMADVVYNIDSKIPQNAIASISQETFSSRIHLGNIYTKLGTLDNRVGRILDALENGSGNKGVTMDTVRYSNGSHGTGDTASVLFDGTLRAVPNFKIDAGPNTSPIKDKTERVFVEFKVPLATQTFFVGFKNDEKHLRPVTGRALFEVGTQDLYIKIPSDSGIDYLWITEGWR